MTSLPPTHAPHALTRAEKHRAINNRPKRCPNCGDTVQASNLARHIRREGERYRRAA